MSPELVLARHLWRRAAATTAWWGLAFGLVVYSSSATYAAAYPHQAQRTQLAASIDGNAGLAALFGPTRALDTVGGFAAWRSLGLLSIVGAIWGVMTGTRLLRGEEEAHRWEMVLAGRTTRGRAAAAGLAALLALVGELAVLTALGAVLGARGAHLDGRTSLLLALALVTPAAIFAVVAALFGQLLATRSSAQRAAATVFGVAYLLRVIAVAGNAGWLNWATPLGWVDATHPFTGSRFAPLLLAWGVVLTLAVLTTVLAGCRDLEAGLIRERTPRAGGLRLLSGPTSLAVRLTAPALAGWVVGVVVLCSVFGLVSESVSKVDDRSQLIQRLSSRIGAGAGGSAAFLGLISVVLAALIALAAAGLAGAMQHSEADGLVDVVVIAPVSRLRWALGRALSAVTGLLLLGGLVGVTLWAATRGQVGSRSLSTLLAAGLNAVPVALAVLGLGLLVFGTRPRWTVAAAYGLVAWSFLDQLVGSAVNAPAWILDLSLLHHLAPAPAADPRWGTNAVLVGLGLAAALVGLAGLRRRDLIRA